MHDVMTSSSRERRAEQDAVEARRELLMNLSRQSAIRPLLAAGELEDRLHELVPDLKQLRAALEGLAKDRDPAIAARARALASSHLAK